MRRLLVLVGCLCGGPLVGCAHHQANQYAYAPPLAPPVYPQPQPVSGPVAPPVVVPAAPVPAGAIPTAAPAAAMPAGQAVLVSGDPCCPPFIEGGGAATPVVYEAAGQTPPCPPAH